MLHEVELLFNVLVSCLLNCHYNIHRDDLHAAFHLCMYSTKCATQVNLGHQFTGLSSGGYQLLMSLTASQLAIISQLHFANCSDPRSAGDC